MNEIEKMLEKDSNDISIRILISIVERSHSIYLHLEMEKLGITLGFGQFQFLTSLYKENHLIQEELAKKHRLNQSTVTRALKKLESKELITRMPDENNRRKNIVKLTEKGKIFTKKIIQIDERWEEKLGETLSNDEEALLKEKLKEMAIKVREFKFK